MSNIFAGFVIGCFDVKKERVIPAPFLKRKQEIQAEQKTGRKLI